MMAFGAEFAGGDFSPPPAPLHADSENPTASEIAKRTMVAFMAISDLMRRLDRATGRFWHYCCFLCTLYTFQAAKLSR